MVFFRYEWSNVNGGNLPTITENGEGTCTMFYLYTFEFLNDWFDIFKWENYDCNELELEDESTLAYPICHISHCRTLSGKFCTFPFKYSGRSYSSCITLGMDGTPWCSTNVDSEGNHIYGFEEACDPSCNVMNCPVGYFRAYPDNTCYKVCNFIIR